MNDSDPPTALDRLDRLIGKAAGAGPRPGPLDGLDLARAGRRWWIPGKAAVRIVSEVLHGETVALDACASLLSGLDDPRARAFLTLQHADERRHVGAYRRYLARLGDVRPAGDAMLIAADGIRTAPGGALGQMAVCHLILENEAIRLHDELSGLLGCPVLDAMNARIGPEEARHVAFGTLYLRHHLRSLDAGTRRDIGRHARRTWHAAARAMFATVFATALVPGRFVETRLERAWPRHRATLAALGLA